MRKRPRRNYTLEYHFLLYRYFCETLYQHLHALLIKTQHSKHAYCQKITRSLSYVLLATRKSVSPYQLSLQRFDKCLAEIVANWSQVGFKLVASWTQKPGPVKIYAQNWVPSRFMRKIVCRLRLNEVNRQ